MPIGVILATPEYYGEFSKSGHVVLEVTESVLSACSDEKTPQGVVASVSYDTPRPEKPSGVCLVLDGVKDPGNVGSLVRTCAALGIKSVYALDCADVYSPKCVRASMCGIYSVNVFPVSVPEREEIFSGARIITADMGGENVFSADISGDFCLVIGSEAHGVSAFFRERAERSVSIPMRGEMESLNAAIAGSIILYELLKTPLR